MFPVLPLLVILLSLTSSFSPAPVAALPEYSYTKMVLLLAHKWKSKSLLLDLKVDGSFEGKDASGALYGLWEMNNDRKTLVLHNDPLDEEEFKYLYKVVNVSFDQLHLKKANGQAVVLHLVE